MNVDTVRIILYAIIILVTLLTAHAWRDYRRRPDRYLRRTKRTDTRRPVRHWTARWIRR